MEPGRVAGVVDHRAADSAAGVVGAHRHRVGAADHPRLGPVQVMGPGLVADPVGVGVPERPRVQADDPPAAPGHPLQQGRAAGPAAHHDQVDHVAVGVPAHVGAQLVIGPAAVVRQQPGRLVAVADCCHRRWRHPRSFPAHRVTGRMGVGDLEGLPRVDSGVLVAARVGGTGEPDLVPGRRVGVERGAGVARPQAPDVGGVQPVPLLGPQVLHRLDDGPLILQRGLRQLARAGGLAVLVEEAQRVPPGLAVFWHVGVAPAVGLLLRQPGVDLRDDLDLRLAVLVLAEQPVAQRGRRGLLGGGEEPDVRRPSDPGQDDARRHRIPVARLVQYVEPGEPLVGGRADTGRGSGVRRSSCPALAAGHFSRRRIAASRPIPPTIVTSSGASSGGPISRL